jgi:hypothetical protein
MGVRRRRLSRLIGEARSLLVQLLGAWKVGLPAHQLHELLNRGHGWQRAVVELELHAHHGVRFVAARELRERAARPFEVTRVEQAIDAGRIQCGHVGIILVPTPAPGRHIVKRLTTCNHLVITPKAPGKAARPRYLLLKLPERPFLTSILGDSS